ncbi:MAG TPA: hypothetical protein VM492_06090 [Sumerlaeia bacterium]|nr:hypothetical protein [Sumerlaeia bacterium]
MIRTHDDPRIANPDADSPNGRPTARAGERQEVLPRQRSFLNPKPELTRVLTLFVLLASPLSAASQDLPAMVKDINTAVLSHYDSDPSEFVEMGGNVYFVAKHEIYGTRVWKSDLTPAGTAPLDGAYDYPKHLAVSGDTLYFTAFDSTHGRELWKSDGASTGTTLVKDVSPGGSSGLSSEAPPWFTDVEGTTFFVANVVKYTSWSDAELWQTDGTEAGTMLVKDGLDIASQPPFFTNVGGTLFFMAMRTSWRADLWKSDGTGAGTSVVTDVEPTADPLFIGGLTAFDGALYFSTLDLLGSNKFWTTDGTPAGTTVVVEKLAILMANVGGSLYFGTEEGELYRSDGTTSGTTLVKDIRPGGDPDYDLVPGYFTEADGGIFFLAGTDATGLELWKTDGTEVGTALVKEIHAGSDSPFDVPYSEPFLAASDGLLFLLADDGINGVELWRSDGTAGGTFMAKNIGAGALPLIPSPTTTAFLGVGLGSLLFPAKDDANGAEIWTSDGSEAGTHIALDVNNLHGSSSPESLTDVNGTLFFFADDGANGYGLWKSNGAEAGTTKIRDGIEPSWTVSSGGRFFFTHSETATGEELWKSDGTSGGTAMVKDIHPGADDSDLAPGVDVNGTLFLQADSGLAGYELWKSNGTQAGTVLVKEIPLSVTSAVPFRSMTNASGILYFVTDNGALWKSDGTEAGTVQVVDLVTSTPPSGADPYSLAVLQNAVYFLAASDLTPLGLWKTDGSPSGTTLVKEVTLLPTSPGYYTPTPRDLLAVGNQLFYVVPVEPVEAGDFSMADYELWRSDGTAVGTARVSTFDELWTGPVGMSGALYFFADQDNGGYDLWRSDGTPAGTSLVADVDAGLPDELTAADGRLFFIDWSALEELWMSDGTAAGTIALDIGPNSSSDYTDHAEFLTVVNDALFFSTSTDAHGRELWRMKVPGGETGPPRAASRFWHQYR